MQGKTTNAKNVRGGANRKKLSNFSIYLKGGTMKWLQGAIAELEKKSKVLQGVYQYTSYLLWMMMLYLIDVLGLNITYAAGIIKVFWGISNMMQLPIHYLLDTFVGSYWMFTISGLANTVGFGLLTILSTPPFLAKDTGTCNLYKLDCLGERQKILLYTSLALISIATSGLLVYIAHLSDEESSGQGVSDIKSSGPFPIWPMAFYFLITGAVFAISYVHAWWVKLLISTLCLLVPTVIYSIEECNHRVKRPQGSELEGVCQVILPALKECKGPPEKQESNVRRRCGEPPRKEAIRFIRFFVFYATFIFCGCVSIVGETYFVAQSNNLKHMIGSLPIPAGILLLFYKIVRGILVYLRPLIPEWCSKKNGIPQIGLLVSMIFATTCCIVAAIVEARRLHVVNYHGLIYKPEEQIPMTIFLLLPQFILLGLFDGILEASIWALSNQQESRQMKRYAFEFAMGAVGIGNILGILSIHIAAKVSEKGGKPSWFRSTLNESRIDKYYWTLAWLSAVNFGVVLVFAVLTYFLCPYPQSDGQGTNQTDVEVDSQGPDTSEQGADQEADGEGNN